MLVLSRDIDDILLVDSISQESSANGKVGRKAGHECSGAGKKASVKEDAIGQAKACHNDYWRWVGHAGVGDGWVTRPKCELKSRRRSTMHTYDSLRLNRI